MHDVGVVVNRRTHYVAGRDLAREILVSNGLPDVTVEKALHVMESHSRYGGPQPHTVEARIGQDSDALEYIGAIGIVRAGVRGLIDGSFSGRACDFPGHLAALLAKVEGSFHTEEAEQIGSKRIAFMRHFLQQIEKELAFEA